MGSINLKLYAVVYAVSVTWCTANKKCVSWASAIDASCVKKRIFLSAGNVSATVRPSGGPRSRPICCVNDAHGRLLLHGAGRLPRVCALPYISKLLTTFPDHWIGSIHSLKFVFTRSHNAGKKTLPDFSLMLLL